MSRFGTNPSYGHRCVRLGSDDYCISWVYDHYYSGDRKRYPREIRRFTDRAGAQRFCRKWGLVLPPEEGDHAK